MGFWPWEVGFKCPAEGLSFTQPGTSEHARRGGAWPGLQVRRVTYGELEGAGDP